MATVSAGARLHFGFGNLSLVRERLYGGLGVGLAEPRLVVSAEPAPEVIVEAADGTPDDGLEECAERAVSTLAVPGARVCLERGLTRHVGLGSGTQLALATLAAVARAHGMEPRVRERAPAMGRGGRSGVGVATFEAGGFVVDAGHPTDRFTTERPADGDWTVPAVVARHRLPADWRFLLVVPAADPGRSGEDEDASIRAVVERADPAVADEVAGLLVRRLLPAAAEGRLEAFGDAVGAIGRKNGAWYADAQGGTFRPPAGALIDALADRPVLSGVGQSSWGPTVYAVTDAAHADEAREEARAALDACGLEGSITLAAPADAGARIEPRPGTNRG